MNFTHIRPEYPEEEVEEDNVIEDEAELNLNKVEEEMMLVSKIKSKINFC